MAPKEAYLTIKAQKAREDAHYGTLATFTAALINVHIPKGKKGVEAEALYEPQLVKQKKTVSADEVRSRQREAKDQARKYAARYSPNNRK